MMTSSRVYVGGISPKIKQDEVESLFSRYGHITRCDFKARADSAFAFIEFEHPRDAEIAIGKLDGLSLGGSRLLVEAARNKFKTKGTVVGGQNRFKERRIIVDNLPSQTSWQDLKDFSRDAGEVVYADVYTDRGRKRGVVEFASESEARKAVRNLHGKRLHGCLIRVIEEVEVEENLRRRSRSRSRSPRYDRRRSEYYSGRRGGYCDRRVRSPSPLSDRDMQLDDDVRPSRSRRRDRSRSRSRSPAHRHSSSSSKSLSPPRAKTARDRSPVSR